MSIDTSTFTVFVAAIALLATTTVCAWSWRLSGFSRRVGALEAVRFVLILLAVLTLMQPEYTAQVMHQGRSVVAVLYDVSGSMETKDVSRDGDLTTRASWLKELKSQRAWSAAAQRMDVVIEPFSSQQEDAKSATDLHAALTDVANRDGVRAIVLASDGDWNIGQSPAAAARELRRRNIPVFTLGVGSEQPLPDLSIASFDVPAFAVVGKPLRIPFTIASTLPRDADVTVEIALSGEDHRSQTLRVPSMGETDGVIEGRPKQIGDEQITIRLPVDKLELIENNNEQTMPLNIRHESLKVLLIDSYPRWEYRYTRNALQRDPGVELRCLLLHPTLNEVGSGRDYLDAFPAEGELLEQDVVILGDVGVADNQLTREQCEQIKRLVQSQASGLVLMPSFRGFQSTLARTPLAELYPVELDAEQPKGIRASSPAQFILTEEGRESLLTRLETQPEANEEIWRNLPGFYWYAAALRAKPGTRVLATHASASTRYGRVPIVATRTFGTGKVLFMGADAAWRWRKGVEDLYHYRFWSQMVRWMAYQRTMSEGKSIRLFFSPDRPRSGDVVTLHANVMDASGEPLQRGHVAAQVIAPSGETSTIDLQKPGGESWGLFSGSFEPEVGGVHRLITTCRETGESLESEVAIYGVPREQVGRPARFEVLKEIAQITKGEMTSIQNLDRITKAVSAIPDPEPIIRRFRLWSHPLWGGAIVVLLGVFWMGRKYQGLI